MTDLGVSRLFSSRPAGRMQPTAWTAPDGSYVVLVGSEDEDAYEDIAAGDRFGFELPVHLTTLTTITWAMRFRQTTSAGLLFRAVIAIDGVPYWSEDLAVGAVTDHAERMINVSELAGLHTLAFYLQAVAA